MPEDDKGAGGRHRSVFAGGPAAANATARQAEPVGLDRHTPQADPQNRGVPSPSAARSLDTIDRLRFHAAVRRWRDTVFRVAYNYLRSKADADDVCQDVFVALYRSGKTFADDEHLKAWLIRTTCNRCRSELRRPWRRVGGIDDLAAWDMPTPAVDAGDPERRALDDLRSRELLAALMRLPRQHRVAIYLRYCEQYTTDRIAVLMGARPATVRSWLARGRKRLENLLEEGAHDDV